MLGGRRGGAVYQPRRATVTRRPIWYTFLHSVPVSVVKKRATVMTTHFPWMTGAQRARGAHWRPTCFWLCREGCCSVSGGPPSSLTPPPHRLPPTSLPCVGSDAAIFLPRALSPRCPSQTIPIHAPARAFKVLRSLGHKTSAGLRQLQLKLHSATDWQASHG